MSEYPKVLKLKCKCGEPLTRFARDAKKEAARRENPTCDRCKSQRQFHTLNARKR